MKIVEVAKELWSNFRSEKDWVVEMTKRPVEYDLRWDYFPRKFKYKRYAVALIREIAKKGGEAALYRDINKI